MDPATRRRDTEGVFVEAMADLQETELEVPASVGQRLWKVAPKLDGGKPH